LAAVEVAGATLPVSPTLKSLSVILDQRLTFDNHTTAVAKSCNYYTGAISNVRHLLPESMALASACVQINSRFDCCKLYYTVTTRAPSNIFINQATLKILMMMMTTTVNKPPQHRTTQLVL